MNILVFGAGAAGLLVAAQFSRGAGGVCRLQGIPCRSSAKTRIPAHRPEGNTAVRFHCTNMPPDQDMDEIFIIAKSITTRKVCRMFAGIIGGRGP